MLVLGLLAPGISAALGDRAGAFSWWLRRGQWQAFNGSKTAAGAQTVTCARRSEGSWSPKLALGFERQRRVPRWRASGLLSHALTPSPDASLGARHGGRQYGNFSNAEYWNFHPHLRRTWLANLGFDL